jgi:transposase
MRGDDEQQNHVFSYLSPEKRVRADHPLRAIRAMVDEVLSQLSRRFDTMYARVGRPSIAPEKLLRAQLLQMLYSIRSERLLMEEMDYNLLFRWFVGLNADDPVWDATTFTKNRDRLLEADVAREFLARVVEQARGKGLTSDEHFTVDGTLLEAWASLTAPAQVHWTSPFLRRFRIGTQHSRHLLRRSELPPILPEKTLDATKLLCVRRHQCQLAV